MRTPISLFVVCLNVVSVCQPAFAAVVPAEISGSYSVAMEYAENKAILEPMSDGLMHPEMPITRQDLVKSVVRDVYQKDIRTDCFDRISPDLHANFQKLFTDVSITNTAAAEICVGMFVGVVEGRPDGSFGVQGTANLVDAAKIVTKAPTASLPSPDFARSPVCRGTNRTGTLWLRETPFREPSKPQCHAHPR